MARVTAYEASDGSLHRDRKAFIQHESNLLVSKKLKPVIENLVGAEKADELHDFIVKGIGLDVLRGLFAEQFKPGASDGSDDGAAGTSSSSDASASAAVEQTGELAAAPSQTGTTPESQSDI